MSSTTEKKFEQIPLELPLPLPEERRPEPKKEPKKSTVIEIDLNESNTNFEV